jgi:hypothetical protein
MPVGRSRYELTTRTVVPIDAPMPARPDLLGGPEGAAAHVDGDDGGDGHHKGDEDERRVHKDRDLAGILAKGPRQNSGAVSRGLGGLERVESEC